VFGGKTKGFYKDEVFRAGSRVQEVGEGMGEGMGARGCFININDMYNNDVGKGGVRVYEAH
jgi:hypothetical protein